MTFVFFFSFLFFTLTLHLNNHAGVAGVAAANVKIYNEIITAFTF